MAVEVAVDPELCIGSGDCVRVAPGAFRLDEDAGVSIPRAEAASTDIALLVRAAEGCPTQAIRVIVDGAVLHESN